LRDKDEDDGYVETGKDSEEMLGVVLAVFTSNTYIPWFHRL